MYGAAFRPFESLSMARFFVYKNSMAKRGRPATGQAPALSIRLPLGWLRQIERMGDKSKVARVLIGSALAARKVHGADGVVPLDSETAKAFLELYHYTGVLPTGRNICFGWFVTGELYAVAAYGHGINQVQHSYLARVTGKPVTRRNLIELRRLARAEPARDGQQLSQFIAVCHRLLRRDHGIRFVVSFSDPAHRHNGGIYRASNFEHLGKTAAEPHVIDQRGRLRSRRMPYHHAKRNGITLAEARQQLGLRVRSTVRRDRWFLDLGEPGVDRRRKRRPLMKAQGDTIIGSIKPQ
jgi:hypothetical protein